MHEGVERWDEAWVANALARGELDQRISPGVTPLWHATYFGRADWVERLLAAGARPDAHDAEGIARSAGEMFGLEIWSGVPDTATAAPTGPGTLLHAAAVRVGSPDVIACLVDRGVDLEGRDRFGATALHIAAFAGHLDAVRCLVERGANVDAIDVAGYAALDHAISKIEILRVLLEAGASPDGGPKVKWHDSSYEWTSVTSAAYWDTAVLGILLDAGADVRKHKEALPLACKHDRPDAVRRLLAAGADVDGTTHWRFRDHRALEAAALYASMESVQLLLSRCAHQLDGALRNAVELSCEDGPAPNDHEAARRELVALLLEAGAQPSAVDLASPADFALTKMLLDAGADPNRPDAYGRPPLCGAAAQGNAQLARALLDAGADPCARTADGTTAWQLAERAYRDAKNADARLVLNALRERGAAPDAPPRPEPVADPFAVGASVQHAKFGEGIVRASEGRGDSLKLTIEFASGGSKTLLARFVRPA
ncbi:MAG: ankyrin repeat domain-containing protein [Sandaracinaceae bacterium]